MNTKTILLNIRDIVHDGCLDSKFTLTSSFSHQETAQMPTHQEERILYYPVDLLYHMVADIERYPDFLPWCLSAKIKERRGGVVVADLEIGYKAFREKFTSIVTLDPPAKISVFYGGGPMKNLTNEWKFEPMGSGVSRVNFFVDFEMKSNLMGRLVDMFFDKAFRKMVTAFEQRAETLMTKQRLRP